MNKESRAPGTIDCAWIDPTLTYAQLEAAQWSVNIQRADISWVDIAQWVSNTYDRIFRDLSNSDELGEQSRESAALTRVADQYFTICGKRMAPRTVRQLRRIARDLADDVKRLASAQNVGQNTLTRISAISGAERQMRALRSELGVDKPDQGSTSGGRPTALQRCGNLIAGAIDVLDRLDEKALARMTAEQTQEILNQLIDYQDQLRERVKRVSRMAKAAGQAATRA